MMHLALGTGGSVKVRGQSAVLRRVAIQPTYLHRIAIPMTSPTRSSVAADHVYTHVHVASG